MPQFCLSFEALTSLLASTLNFSKLAAQIPIVQWFDKLYQLNGQFVGKRRKVVKKNPVKILDDFLSPGKSIRNNLVLNNCFGHDLLEFYLVFISFN